MNVGNRPSDSSSQPEEMVALRENSLARLTGLGLLLSGIGCGLLGLALAIFDGLESVEFTAIVAVVSIGLPAGILLLLVPDALTRHLPGRTVLLLALASLLLLLWVIAPHIADYGDPELGMQPGSLAFDLLAVAFTLTVITGCVCVLIGVGSDRNAARRRTASRLGLSLAAGFLLATAVAASADSTGLRCATFRFDEKRWRDDGPTAVRSVNARERIGRSLVQCGTLIGKTSGDIQRMLGRDKRREHRLRYSVGIVHDALGPGDEGSLWVRFGAHGRVTRAFLDYERFDENAD
jgi:hypothetical protein